MEKVLAVFKLGEMGSVSIGLSGIDLVARAQVKKGFLSFDVSGNLEGIGVLELVKKIIPGNLEDGLIEMLEKQYGKPPAPPAV